jgi:rhodanese-related sulfurtransferase
LTVKKLLALVAVLGALVLTGCGSSGSVTSVDAATFLSNASQPGVVVVDVRTPAEYAAGHVKDAVNIDVEDASFDGQIAKLDKATTYAVYCRSGNRSKVATDAMDKAGFTKVYNLSGGLTDLASAGATVVTS